MHDLNTSDRELKLFSRMFKREAFSSRYHLPIKNNEHTHKGGSVLYFSYSVLFFPWIYLFWSMLLGFCEPRLSTWLEIV